MSTLDDPGGRIRNRHYCFARSPFVLNEFPICYNHSICRVIAIMASDFLTPFLVPPLDVLYPLFVAFGAVNTLMPSGPHAVRTPTFDATTPAPR
jgi:hypothetical protein